VIPGGRREPGETTVAAIQRELLEETGWVVGNLRPFAFLHFHYETPRPSHVIRIFYPDFIWHIFLAEPVEYRASERVQDTSEVILEASFRPVSEVLKATLAPFQRALLAALPQ
jgi:8-oxo-dGTP pyrophosphatase MutT (NUDIX family)